MMLAIMGVALASPDSSSVLTITGVARPSADGIPLQVSAGDLDGDGRSEEGMLLLRCSGGTVSSAVFHYNVKSPRDAASGQASGRRTHVMPHVFEPAGARLAGMRPTYDVKKVEGARMAGRRGYDYYKSLSLSGADGLCAAANEQAAKVKATKSRSNIQNN